MLASTLAQEHPRISPRPSASPKLRATWPPLATEDGRRTQSTARTVVRRPPSNTQDARHDP